MEISQVIILPSNQRQCARLNCFQSYILLSNIYRKSKHQKCFKNVLHSVMEITTQGTFTKRFLKSCYAHMQKKCQFFGNLVNKCCLTQSLINNNKYFSNTLHLTKFSKEYPISQLARPSQIRRDFSQVVQIELWTFARPC